MSGDRLWLALRFGDLPLSALEAATEQDEPVAVSEKQQVVYCNTAAQSAGIAPGMDISTSLLLSNCRVRERDAARERGILDELRDALYAFTPHINIHRSRQGFQCGLLLEISTCLKLFSGLQNLCRAVLDFIGATPYQVRPGLAHTPEGAWLLTFSRCHPGEDTTREQFINRLNLLPVRVLHDYPDAVDSLLKMGFYTLGDVARQIESSAVASFTRRLGREFAAVIADIYDIDRDFSQGRLFSKPVGTYIPQAHFEDRILFDYPVSRVEQLEPAFESLLQKLSEFLRKRQLECQHIRWQIADIYQQRETVDVYSDIPQGGWQLLQELTLITFENRPIPFEVDCLELVCREYQPCRANTRKLDFSATGRSRDSERELTATLAKLKIRLGESAVHKISYRDSLLPELSQAIIELAEKAAQQLPEAHKYSLRPSWLFSPPKTVEYRGKHLFWQGYLTLAAGPERLVGHWWAEPVARDYYLARRQDNVAVWIYRDLYGKGWYVHGVFS